jgi:hypothetical protein
MQWVRNSIDRLAFVQAKIAINQGIETSLYTRISSKFEILSIYASFVIFFSLLSR